MMITGLLLLPECHQQKPRLGLVYSVEQMEDQTALYLQTELHL